MISSLLPKLETDKSKLFSTQVAYVCIDPSVATVIEKVEFGAGNGFGVRVACSDCCEKVPTP